MCAAIGCFVVPEKGVHATLYTSGFSGVQFDVVNMDLATVLISCMTSKHIFLLFYTVRAPCTCTFLEEAGTPGVPGCAHPGGTVYTLTL